MHTVDGRPAEFSGNQIYIKNGGGVGQKGITRLASSLDQIYRERRETIRYRRAMGYPAKGYGYIRLVIKV